MKALTLGGSGVLGVGVFMWGAQGFTLPVMLILFVGVGILITSFVVYRRGMRVEE